jgi:uncharacterized membrane protein YhaH (DUF805 family)
VCIYYTVHAMRASDKWMHGWLALLVAVFFVGFDLLRFDSGQQSSCHTRDGTQHEG